MFSECVLDLSELFMLINNVITPFVLVLFTIKYKSTVNTFSV